jgi:hypothetical protein
VAGDKLVFCLSAVHEEDERHPALEEIPIIFPPVKPKKHLTGEAGF